MRFLRFAKELERIHEETGGVDRVFYEKVMGHKSVLASHMYGGFEAVMLGFCANHGIPFGEVHVSTLKKYATGSGRADSGQIAGSARTPRTRNMRSLMPASTVGRQASAARAKRLKAPR